MYDLKKCNLKKRKYGLKFKNTCIQLKEWKQIEDGMELNSCYQTIVLSQCVGGSKEKSGQYGSYSRVITPADKLCIPHSKLFT